MTRRFLLALLLMACGVGAQTKKEDCVTSENTKMLMRGAYKCGQVAAAKDLIGIVTYATSHCAEIEKAMQ